MKGVPPRSMAIPFSILDAAHAMGRVRVVTIIDLLPITVIDGSRGLHESGQDN